MDLNAASDSAPTLASETITCNSVPVSPAPPSRSVAKHNFPEFRWKMTRPVMPTNSPVSVSGGRSGNASLSAANVVVRSTPTGYGSIPSSIRRCRLSRRTRSCSGRSSPSLWAGFVGFVTAENPTLQRRGRRPARAGQRVRMRDSRAQRSQSTGAEQSGRAGSTAVDSPTGNRGDRRSPTARWPPHSPARPRSMPGCDPTIRRRPSMRPCRPARHGCSIWVPAPAS